MEEKRKSSFKGSNVHREEQGVVPNTKELVKQRSNVDHERKAKASIWKLT